MSAGSGWAKILLGGLGVAVFTFLAPLVWEKLSRRPVGPDHVRIAARIEDGAILFLVRNDSDDPLDLVAASLAIRMPPTLGAYPAPSRRYSVRGAPDAEIETDGAGLRLRLRIAQAIEAGGVDQFGLVLDGAETPLALAPGSVEGVLTDLEGNEYPVRY